MSNLGDISLKKILDLTDIIMKKNEIVYICNDINTIKEFLKLDKKNNITNIEIKEFLLQHENEINKEKLLMIIIKNYKINLKLMSEKVEKNKKLIANNIGLIDEDTIEKMKLENLQLGIESKKQKECLKEAKKLGKGIEAYISEYFYNKNTQKYDLEILESNEIIDEVSTSKKKNLQRFKKIDSELKKNSNEQIDGIEDMLQVIVLTDFCAIFPDENFGDDIRTLILENAVLKEKIKTREELDELKIKKYDEYNEIIENTNFENLLPDIEETLEKYIKYVDIDKLLMILAYRFQEGLESKCIAPEHIKYVKSILEVILENVKDKAFTFNIQNKQDGSYKQISLCYSTKDIEKCIKHFTNDSYVTKNDIKEIRQSTILGEKNLSEIGEDELNIALRKEELEELTKLNDDNFMYVSSKLNWNKEKILSKIKSRNGCSIELLNQLINKKEINDKDIIGLYMNGILELEKIQSIKGKMDFSNDVNSYELNQYYLNNIKENNEESKGKYKRYLNLYKEILIKDKSENLEENSNNIMEQLVENYDKNHKDDYIQSIENYYKEGLLTLNTILEWNDEDVVKEVVTKLHKEGSIKLEEIEQAVKNRKIPFEYIKELIWKEDIGYEERVKMLEEGWIPEIEIFELFSKGLLYEKDLYELAKKAIISEKRVKEIIEDTSLQDIEENSNIVISDDLKKITKEKDIYANSEENKNHSIKDKKGPKIIIDPNKRKEFFDLLGALEPTDIRVNENSPFYNYEFYIIPDENGKKGRNSIVIAERFYEEKERNDKNDEISKENKARKPNSKIKFATDNATYFFKLKDLMVLSNYLKKDEVVKESDKVVYKANHTLATDEKNGHWAASVLYSMVKTMLSSDLKEYSKENQRKIIVEKLLKVYDYDRLMEILNEAEKIDIGEYNGEIVDEEFADAEFERE